MIESTNKDTKETVDCGELSTKSGEPGQFPFWNRYSQRFIFPPAFDMDADPNRQVKGYRYTVTSTVNGEEYSFDADYPYAPLTPIWDQLPVGPATLQLASIAKDDNIRQLEQVRSFIKAQAFQGDNEKPRVSYKESAVQAITGLMKSKTYQSWLKGCPDDYYFNVYPAKMFSSTIAGMVAFARISTDPTIQAEALSIAKNCATYQIKQAPPEGHPTAFLPPTYDPEHPTAHKFWWMKEWATGRIMLTEYAQIIEAWLDLYEATKDDYFLSSAKKVADTLKRLQREDGSWPLKVWVDTGDVFQSNIVIPTAYVNTFERLINSYHCGEFQVVLDRILHWIWENPMKNYLWEAQFEDVPHNYGYLNLSHYGPGDFAMYLLRNTQSNPDLLKPALELVNFIEDQFVLWDAPKDDSINPWEVEPSTNWPNAVTPCVVEQYWCYRPINASTAHTIQVFLEAFKVTANPVYMEKAKSLANTLTKTQDPESGEYLTFLYHDGMLQGELWNNCATLAARTLLKLDETERKHPAGVATQIAK